MISVGRSRLAAATAVVVTLTGGLVAFATTSASAATCATNTFTRQFFANTGFSGAAKRTDCDASVNENWGTKSPGVSGVGADNFGVRWQVTRDFGSGGPFAFAASGQDGIRVYLDGVRKIDLWKNGSATVSKTVNLTVPKGTHTLRIDYVNWTGAAAAKFAYTPRSGAAPDRVAPLAPGGPSIARDAGTGRNFLRWSANKEMDLAGYRVYRRAAGQTSFGSPVATVTGTSFTDTTAGTATHLYEIRAADKSGNLSAGTADVSVTQNPVFLRQFFANTTFTGTPRSTDTDASVNENWGTKSPGVSGVGADNFGVRWQVTRDFGSGGPFAFAASGQDGIRVYLDGVRKIDLWKNGSATVSKTVNLTVPKGTHTLRIDYVNWTGAAAAKFAYTPRTDPAVDKVAPLAPTGVKVRYDGATDSATVSWAPNKEMDLAYYRVYRETASGDYMVMVLTDKTTWTATGLPRNGKPIGFYVAVTDRSGNLSANDPLVKITPVDTVTPKTPVVHVSHLDNTPHSLKINWDASTEDELRNGGTLRVYRSTGDTLGDTPELIATTSSPTTSAVYVYVDDTRVFDGTTYTYAVTVTDAAGNTSPMSAPDSVTPDSVPPAPVTGLTSAPAVNGTLLSWDAPAESGVRFTAARVVQGLDGTVHYDSTGCHDAAQPGDLPNTMLCVGPADGETVTFLVMTSDEWQNHLPVASAPTITATELDTRPDEARAAIPGPITIIDPEKVGESPAAVRWTCSDEAVCAGVTAYHVDVWNPVTSAYTPVRTVMASGKGAEYLGYVPLPLGETSHFRITGILADGSALATAYVAGARGRAV
ncbi:PA14 domain-containing protein [Streptomyces sp. NPDC008125]|uniref:PA14 domain-containing protein n=1 Tax=Streptomyces sp. NPDC008125 TaxID=3364811 RepID=UPI0036EBCF65